MICCGDNFWSIWYSSAEFSGILHKVAWLEWFLVLPPVLLCFPARVTRVLDIRIRGTKSTIPRFLGLMICCGVNLWSISNTTYQFWLPSGGDLGTRIVRGHEYVTFL